MKKFIKPVVLALGLLSITGQASAHVTSAGTVFDFSSGIFRDALAGQVAFMSLPGAVFPRDGQDYVQDGIQYSAIGFGTAPGLSVGTIANDFGGGSSHVHGQTTGGSRVGELAADAGGGFFKLLDGDPFSVAGLDVARFSSAMQDGSNGTLNFRGYTSADFTSFTDVTLGVDALGNMFSVGGNFATEIGTPTNGFNGTHLHLDDVSAFGELYLFEYWFDAFGRATNPIFSPNSNNGLNLAVEIDNVEFGAVVSAVPVPAAAYLFCTALLGLGGLSRKKEAV